MILYRTLDLGYDFFDESLEKIQEKINFLIDQNGKDSTIAIREDYGDINISLHTCREETKEEEALRLKKVEYYSILKELEKDKKVKQYLDLKEKINNG